MKTIDLLGVYSFHNRFLVHLTIENKEFFHMYVLFTVKSKEYSKKY